MPFLVLLSLLYSVQPQEGGVWEIFGREQGQEQDRGCVAQAHQGSCWPGEEGAKL